MLETWPPSADFFGGTPIGVAYYVQKWFRYKLQEWITRRMRELESKDRVYSLENWLQFHFRWIIQELTEPWMEAEPSVSRIVLGNLRTIRGTLWRLMPV